ncbi:uncharacterized protein CLUP02_15846 [Colletotrichum lupini]|uniref:Uncharacterized protein n=1 Tax=Colletotrichum lupini TaxID=145971 RepID=A0A9Q8T6U7_9PEZI|nr:uncharacterized protein CLUP02_15846 [Colletotrichum lupini]UQC90316.1 hypothetical protein CLUP02_15846 [Colletotrichum lupini]
MFANADSMFLAVGFVSYRPGRHRGQPSGDIVFKLGLMKSGRLNYCVLVRRSLSKARFGTRELQERDRLRRDVFVLLLCGSGIWLPQDREARSRMFGTRAGTIGVYPVVESLEVKESEMQPRTGNHVIWGLLPKYSSAGKPPIWTADFLGDNCNHFNHPFSSRSQSVRNSFPISLPSEFTPWVRHENVTTQKQLMDCQVFAFGLVLPHDWICPPSAPVSAEKPFCASRLQTTSNKGSVAARAPGHTRRYRRVSQFVEYLVPYPRRRKHSVPSIRHVGIPQGLIHQRGSAAGRNNGLDYPYARRNQRRQLPLLGQAWGLHSIILQPFPPQPEAWPFVRVVLFFAF